MTGVQTSLAWAAGIFEGEGTIISQQHRLRLVVSMTDRDVVDRFAEVVGCGAVAPARRLQQKPHWKPQWRWVACGEEAVAVFEALRPWLLARRQARFDELLGERLRYIERVTARRSCERCGRRFRPSLRGQRARYCSKGCQKRGRRSDLEGQVSLL